MNDSSNIIAVDSLDDSRVSLYRNIKDHELLDRGRFLAEGDLLVRRALGAGIEVESILVAERKCASIASIAPAHVPIYRATEQVVNQILGYRFHTGLIAVCRVPPRRTLQDVLPRESSRATVVVCPDLNNAENLGTIFRTGAALGIDAILIGERSINPWMRLSVRVSMGTIFRMPFAWSRDITRDLALLKSEFGYELIGTAITESAEELATFQRSERTAVLLGSEATGLPADFLQACDRLVTIPMHRQTDSLNVSVAAGIVLWELTKRRQ